MGYFKRFVRLLSLGVTVFVVMGCQLSANCAAGLTGAVCRPTTDGPIVPGFIWASGFSNPMTGRRDGSLITAIAADLTVWGDPSQYKMGSFIASEATALKLKDALNEDVACNESGIIQFERDKHDVYLETVEINVKGNARFDISVPMDSTGPVVYYHFRVGEEETVTILPKGFLDEEGNELVTVQVLGDGSYGFPTILHGDLTEVSCTEELDPG